jgi:hypothetical protein
MAAPETDRDGNPVYAYKPSLLGAPSEFRLDPDALVWQLGRHGGRIPYDRIKAVRLSYRPATMQPHRFVTEVWAPASPKIQIVSTSWRGLTEQERFDRPYAAFVTELHRRLAAAGSNATFSAGLPTVMYWVGVAVFVPVVIGVAVMAARLILEGQWIAAAIVGGLFLVFGYQLASHFLRNQPQRYRPDAIPPSVLPRT